MRGQHGGTPGALELRAATGRSLRVLAAAAVLIGFGWWMARNPQEVRGGDAYLWTWGSAFGFRGLPIDVTGLTMRPEDVVAEVRRRLQARVER